MKKWNVKQNNRYWTESNSIWIDAETKEEALKIAEKMEDDFEYDEDGDNVYYDIEEEKE